MGIDGRGSFLRYSIGMDKVVVIMPTYNEKENIGRMIDSLFDEEFPKITGAEMHLLVVDDNSPDGTGEVVREKMKKFKNLHILTGEKQGLGMAYARGMRYAMDKMGADAVMEMDADFQHDPKYVKDMVAAYLSGADYVIGSRYIKGGSIPSGWEWHRKAVSYFGNLFARIVLFLPQLHDMTTGFRLTRVKGVLEKIELSKLMELARFAHKVDLFYQTVKLSKKTVEVPIHFAERAKETSKFSFKEVFTTYKVVLLIRLRESIRFLKFGTVGFIGFVVNAVGIEVFRRLALTEGLAAAFLSVSGVWGLGVMAEPSSWAAALGAELSIISNFTLNNIWTFREKRITEPGKLVGKFLTFNLTSLGAIVIQFAVIGAAVGIFGDTTLVRQGALVAAIAFLIIPYNYTMYNLFIWKTWKLPWQKRK